MINHPVRFLKKGFLAFAILLLLNETVIAQAATDVIRKFTAYPDAPNALYNHLSRQAFAYLDKRTKAVNAISSLAGWKQYQASISKKLMEVLGPFPKKNSLNARVLRTISKEDFTVEHIVFESQPEFYVTSSLFIPKGTTNGKFPAVIYCSGHTPSSYRGGTYQQIILNLVKKGFVVFAIDPVGQGERIEYLDSVTNKSIVGAPTREHNYPGAQAFISGSSYARFMIWDGIRAVDYLVTRKEIDPARIGITGRSGGGTQSAYIAALDNRIYAAAPEGYITNHTRLLQTIGPQDAEQIFKGGISHGLDHPDLLEVRAPKPLLIITTTNDFFSIQGAKETETEVAKIYRSYRKSENFSRAEDVEEHASTKKNREAMYAFFQKHLAMPGSPVDEKLPLLSQEEMKVTPSGQLATSLGGETVFGINQKETEQLVKKLQTSRQNLATHLPAVVHAAKTLSGYLEPGSKDEPVYVGIIEKGEYNIEKYFVTGEGDYVIPYVLMVPKKGNSKALLYLHPQGKSAEGASGEIEWFVKNGFTVLAPDLIGTGEVGPGRLSRDNYFSHIKNKGLSYEAWYASLLVGRSIVGIRAADVVKLARLLKANTTYKEVYALAKSEMTPVLLHAAAFSKDISRIALVEPYLSYRAIVMNRFYNPGFIESTVAGALAAYDLPDLAASIAPRKLLLVNGRDASGKVAGSGIVNEDAGVIQKGYAFRSVASQLKIIDDPQITTNRQAFLDWLQ